MSVARIVFPPQFEPFQVYLAGPMLVALLDRLGVPASFYDANIAFYNWLGHRARKSQSGTRQDAGCDMLKSPVESAVRYKTSIALVEGELSSSAPVDWDFSLTRCRVNGSFDASSVVRQALEPNSTLENFCSDHGTDLLGPGGCRTYLLTLVVIDQVPALVAIAMHIRRRRPDVTILIGGPLVTPRFKQTLTAVLPNGLIDEILPGEAERVLPRLLGRPWTVGKHVTPNYSDVEFDAYWSPYRVLPYLVAHGCKWGKCTFCTHHLSYQGYRSSTIDSVVTDLETLSRKHKVRYVSFSDEYLTVEQLDELSDALIERALDIRWSTFVKPEKGFTDHERVAKYAHAGCRMLMFGFESAAQRVLQLMKKGATSRHYGPILEACKLARIAVRLDILVGFPGETEADAQETHDFLASHRPVIDTPMSSIAVGAFEMRDNIPLLEVPKQMERIQLGGPLRGDLDHQLAYTHIGASQADGAEWRDRIIDLIRREYEWEYLTPPNKTHQLIFADLWRSGELELPPSVAEWLSSAGGMAKLIEGAKLTGQSLTSVVNGGDIELEPGVAASLQCLLTPPATIDRAKKAFRTDEGQSLLSYLVKNDFIELTCARDDGSSCPGVEVLSAATP